MRMARWVSLVFVLATAAACAPPGRPAAEPAPRVAPVASLVDPVRFPVPAPAEPVFPVPDLDVDHAAHYAARNDGRVKLPAISHGRFDPAFLRQRVPYVTHEPPGTIVVDTAARQLYLVEDGGTAIRYGIAIGRDGFGWTGTGEIGRAAKWPTWTPPPEMIRRDPRLSRWRTGMPGSPKNPLGARALYIFFDGRDSQFRIHGTNDPMSIGTASSSGCFRMLNQDVIDLYERVELGARVVVI